MEIIAAIFAAAIAASLLSLVLLLAAMWLIGKVLALLRGDERPD